jgi:hypothetical protein
VSAQPGPPRLDLVVPALNASGARFVVIGGFAVIAHRFVRATRDIDILVPDDAENDGRVVRGLTSLNAARAHDGAPLADDHLRGAAHLRALTDGGLVDVVREGVAPLDFDTVSAGALRADLGDGEFLVAGLSSVVGFKRLAGRPVDLRDLEELARIHGELPVEPIPGLDE